MDELLEQVKKEFVKLHSINGKPSKKLKEKVAELLSYYPRKFINKAIGVPSGTLSNWKIRNKSIKTKEKKEPKFVQLSPTIPIDAPKNIPTATIEKLELMLPNNIKLLINNSSIKSTAKIVRHVVEEFSK